MSDKLSTRQMVSVQFDELCPETQDTLEAFLLSSDRGAASSAAILALATELQGVKEELAELRRGGGATDGS